MPAWARPPGLCQSSLAHLRLVATAAVFFSPKARSTSKLQYLPPLCKGCLTEPLETEYFQAADPAPDSPVEPPRLAAAGAMAAEELSLLFSEAARSGKALLIKNATDGTAMAGWSCAKLAEEFPKARMRREYDWVKNPDDVNLVKMGDAGWIASAEPGQDAKERLSQDDKAPPFAPFYWGVREYYNKDNPVGTKKTVKRVKELIAESVPAFMNKGNGESMFQNAEFWLGAKGTGARAHMDSHCISTLSVVLSGERRWRIGPVPRLPRSGGRSPDGEVVYDDGVAYKLGWQPMFEFVAKEGDAVLFPPGWIHETLNSADGCTVALTTQFDIPWPARYYRNYYQRLRRTGDLHPCWRRMAAVASLGDAKASKVALGEAARYAEELFQRRNATLSAAEVDFHDVDGDGQVSLAEFVETFVGWVKTEAAVRKEKQARMPKYDMSLKPGSATAAEL